MSLPYDDDVVDTISPSSSGERAREARLEADIWWTLDCHDMDEYRRIIADGKRAAASLNASSGASSAMATAVPKAAAEAEPERDATPGLQRDGSSESFEEEETDPSVPFDHGLGIHGKAPPAAWVQARALPQ